MIKVFIVILNWNRKQETLECLRSIGDLRLTNYDLRVVVVDNGSTEDMEDIPYRKGELGIGGIEDIKVIKNSNNLGFSGGNNVGIRYALEKGGDFVLLLNNDTLVEQKLIVHLIEVANRHKEAGVFSPKIYFAPGFEFHKERYEDKDLGKVIWYAGGKFDWNNVYGVNHGVDEVDHGQFDEVRETDFATGAAMFFRREALKDVGLFDEKYFMYLEDVDLSLRAKKRGWKVLYAAPAQLWHKVAQSSGIGSDLNDYYLTRNRLLFGYRYAPLRTKFALSRESIKLLLKGRKWQKRGVTDFYFGKFGKGSWNGD